MPSRNVVKQYSPESYYHLYNRGVDKQNIFKDDEDYKYFLYLLKRHLSNEVARDTKKRPYKNFHEELELLAFCLMPNHLHLLVYQNSARSIEEFSRSLMTSYSMYFNLKYDRVGGLFQGRIKGSKIDDEPYLWHISRYIHLNPLDIGMNYDKYPFSSYPYYTKNWSASWLQNKRILDIHNQYQQSYQDFVSDYTSVKAIKSELKHLLD